MLKPIMIAMTALALPVLAAASPVEQQSRVAPAGPANIRMAQACWYAIMACSPSHAEANRWSNSHGVGRVINTSSDEFPNFTPGYYCVVEGPMSQGEAQSTARSYRGISPTAYAKSGC